MNNPRNMTYYKSMNKVPHLLLNDKFIMFWVLLNAVVVFLQASDVDNVILTIVDALCTVLFLAELIAKLLRLGFKGYFSSRWNILDFVVTIFALPSLIMLFLPSSWQDLSVFLVLRSLRMFKLFRASRWFPNLNQVWAGFRLALRQSKAILLGFAIMIVVLAVINCYLFRRAAPQYFDTPMDSIYSVFRLFTVEGWYEIPDQVVVGMGWTWKPAIHLIRLYFSTLLIGGGIIGMSFLNSIFVDAMAADNNDDIKEQLDRIEAKLEELMKNRRESDKDESRI